MQLRKANQQHQRSHLQLLLSEHSFPGDEMQIDLVGPLQSPIYKYAFTGIDVFSKYLLAVALKNERVSRHSSKRVGKDFVQYSYFPKTIVSDLGTTFTSSLMHEICSVLETRLKHATFTNFWTSEMHTLNSETKNEFKHKRAAEPPKQIHSKVFTKKS